MTGRLQNLWRTLVGTDSRQPTSMPLIAEASPGQVTVEAVDFAPNDPIIAYLQSAGGMVEIESLSLDSPAVDALKQAGVKIAVPLLSQGELVGLLNLGAHLGEQEYSTDDHRLLRDLASQAAPAVRVAQLVRQQEADTRERERFEQELEVARVIQRTLLPTELPELPGWQIASYYQPAREVGGDFYDFLTLPDDKLGIVVGDVTDKGVPAALVMATTRAVLRAAAERLVSPGAVLHRVNEMLYADIPPRMFVTCLYAVLDPKTGTMTYANAGHDLPYRRTTEGVDELRATGMPLGLMPGMTYEEKEATVANGQCVLFHSDGLAEAHSLEREMFGFPRLKDLMARHPGGEGLIPHLLSGLAEFTGADWEQEDDVTLVTLQRSPSSAGNPSGGIASSGGTVAAPDGNGSDTQIVADFTLPSQPGNERKAMERVVKSLKDLAIAKPKLERLKTAVSEATMNAMEHGNSYKADLPVTIQVAVSETAVAVQITDHGGGEAIPEAGTPDLEAKLSGEQKARGWGLFLIKNMVDEMKVVSDDVHHTVELIFHLDAGSGATDGA